jgi:hypothetical protein
MWAGLPAHVASAYGRPVIQRIVLIKLKPQYRSDAARRQIRDKTREVLPAAYGVRALSITEPSDAQTRRQWDLCLLLRFDTPDDVETYRTDPVHRQYADVFLKPLREKIYVYNFEICA